MKELKPFGMFLWTIYVTALKNRILLYYFVEGKNLN